eukprot:NODE_8303_length_1506_cov_5.476432.p1 GENE.NODE_8303_length_1506_cov_5.476432~~NODE_8303_length_1506_cov_5.476432.p1  ORF type:complete len:353 (+),score=115.44 NODE_8303_length_1506_cov_5.476432:41-1099(+)
MGGNASRSNLQVADSPSESGQKCALSAPLDEYFSSPHEFWKYFTEAVKEPVELPVGRITGAIARFQGATVGNHEVEECADGAWVVKTLVSTGFVGFATGNADVNLVFRFAVDAEAEVATLSLCRAVEEYDPESVVNVTYLRLHSAPLRVETWAVSTGRRRAGQKVKQRFLQILADAVGLVASDARVQVSVVPPGGVYGRGAKSCVTASLEHVGPDGGLSPEEVFRAFERWAQRTGAKDGGPSGSGASNRSVHSDGNGVHNVIISSGEDTELETHRVDHDELLYTIVTYADDAEAFRPELATMVTSIRGHRDPFRLECWGMEQAVRSPGRVEMMRGYADKAIAKALAARQELE